MSANVRVLELRQPTAQGRFYGTPPQTRCRCPNQEQMNHSHVCVGCRSGVTVCWLRCRPRCREGHPVHSTGHLRSSLHVASLKYEFNFLHSEVFGPHCCFEVLITLTCKINTSYTFHITIAETITFYILGCGSW